MQTIALVNAGRFLPAKPDAAARTAGRLIATWPAGVDRCEPVTLVCDCRNDTQNKGIGMKPRLPALAAAIPAGGSFIKGREEATDGGATAAGKDR